MLSIGAIRLFPSDDVSLGAVRTGTSVVAKLASRGNFVDMGAGRQAPGARLVKPGELFSVIDRGLKAIYFSSATGS